MGEEVKDDIINVIINIYNSSMDLKLMARTNGDL